MKPRFKRPHSDLRLWRESIVLAKQIYAITAEFPQDERFGLTAQMRRCAVSIPSNIAEGAARAGNAEFLHFLHIARGSLAELETQIELACELNFIKKETASLIEQIETVSSLLSGLIRLRKKKT